jgi:hypothetical protein
MDCPKRHDTAVVATTNFVYAECPELRGNLARRDYGAAGGAAPW